MGLFDWFFSKTEVDSASEVLKDVLHEEYQTIPNPILEYEEQENQYEEQRIRGALDYAINLSSEVEDRKRFDVFLAHNSVDKPFVRAIAKKIKERDLKPWLDEEQIKPGTFFQDAIQQAITQVKSAAVFIGPSSLGKWQLLELRAFISVLVDQNIPVIPVLLPGNSTIPSDLIFLNGLNWVEFSEGPDDEEAFRRLIWGITGEYYYS